MSAADGAVYAGCEPSALFRSDDGGDSGASSRRCSTFLAPELELPAEALDVPCALDRAVPARCRAAARRDRARRADAQRRRRRVLGGPSARGTARRPLARVAPGGRDARLRGRRRGSAWSFDAGESWQPADEGRDRHYTWSVAPDPEDADRWFVSASTGPFAAHGGRDAQHASSAGSATGLARARRRAARAAHGHAVRARPHRGSPLRGALGRADLRERRPRRVVAALAVEGALGRLHALGAAA